ncbi:MAG: exo-beta-N-acetylmuramidase NamZ domain-containing protein [Candidatus Izemoplasmatales bacterium]
MVKLGIDLINKHKHLFKNKRLGLITNPTGVNSDLVSTIDILNKETNLVALFSPEHGVRGDLQAGVKAEDYIDDITGIKVYSLYGKSKKPTKEMMDNIDLLAFDIQDVGARFYTYLYTMAYAMMACKEHQVPMIVFDRPNPVNASTVEGNILNTDFRSFVGYYPIPQRYGLTIGELAKMFNEDFNINADLKVIEMENYHRDMDYFDTGLPFIFPSPNIPTVESCYAYLSTCIFEGTNLSEGRGTTKPFQIIGSPYLDTDWLIETLDKYNLSGVKFRKLYFTPTFSKNKDNLCKGIELIITNKGTFQPVITGFILLNLIRNHHDQFEFLPSFSKDGHPFLDLLVGEDFLRKNQYTIDELIDLINKDSNKFKDLKRRYHLYD